VQNLLRNIHTLVFGVAGAGKRAVLSPIDDGFRFRAVPYSLMPSSVLLCCPLILLGFEFKKLW
jgi:hypothetical protein